MKNVILHVGNLELVESSINKNCLKHQALYKRLSFLDIILFTDSPLAPTPLSLGWVVLPVFCIHAWSDLLNNCFPYCLLLLVLTECTVKRGGLHSSAYSAARSPGEPWWLWLCRSAGFLSFLSFATFLFPFAPFPWMYLACTSVYCALWNASRCSGCLSLLSLSENLIVRRWPNASICTCRTKRLRKHTTPKGLSSS